jgi:MoxR-like ATPase
MNMWKDLSKEEMLRSASVLGVALTGTRQDQVVDALEASGYSSRAIMDASRAPITPAGLGGQVDSIVAAAVASAEARLSGQIQSVADSVRAAKPVDVSASVAKAVADAFKPMRDAMQTAPADVVDRVVAAAPRERRPIAEVFDIVMPGDCEVWGAPGKFDPDYIFLPEQLSLALLALESGDNFWLWGERGTGKTQFAVNLAARLGRPFFRVSFDANLERAEFVGADGLENGATKWKDGVVLQAYRTPGAVCLLDEASTCRPEYATALHALLEPGSSFTVTSTGEKVDRAAGMCFIAADNTNATGDSSGRYAGTRVQNAALVDRFAFTEKVTFLPEATEIALLVKHGADADVAKSLINVFTRCRAEVGGALVEPPSLRAAFAFARYVRVLSPLRAWEVTVVNKSPEESHETLRQIFSAHWSNNA